MSENIPEAAKETELGIARYAYVIGRQWRVVVAGVILGGLLALGFLLVTPQEFTATADARVNVISSDPFSSAHAPSTLLDDQTETQIASSFVVAQAASKALGGTPTAGTLRSDSSITASAGATIIHVAFAAPTAKDAKRGADAIARAYLDYRETTARNQIKTILGLVQEDLTGLELKLVDANAQLAAAGTNGAAAASATSARELVLAEITSVLTQKSDLGQIDTDGGSLLTAAAENETSHAPKTSLVLVGGLLAGGVLGLIAAFPVNVFDRKIRSAREADRALGSLVLTDIEEADASLPEHGVTLELVMTAKERLFARLTPELRTIAMMDDSPGQDGSDIPANLALAVAQSGRPTQLLITSLSPEHRSAIRAQLGLTRVSGDKYGALYRCKLAPTLTVYLPSATSPDPQADPGLPQRISDQVNKSSPDELVFIALPARVASSIRLAIERVSDAALLVIATRSSRTDHVAAIIDELASTSTPLLGAITVPRDRSLAPVGPTLER